MSFFAKSDPKPAYLKMGIYGEAGSGKTYTASTIAIGLSGVVKAATKAAPPIMFLDTETGSDWVQPLVEKAGLEFYARKSRAFDDLKQSVIEAEKAQGILIVDSMTHFWEEIREAYLQAKRRRLKNPTARLELPDWNVIKPEWAKFTTLFLNSSAHIILCGRAASIYEFQENDEGTKKEMITAGTRMAAEKGMGYEPNILIEMTAHQAKGARKTKTIIRRATVLKDRSTLLDGRVFDNPKFADFGPHIKRLNLGGVHSGIDTTRSSAGLFPMSDKADNSLQRKIVLDEIQSSLVSHFPGQTAEHKKAKVDLLKKHWNAAWTEMESVMPLLSLRAGFDALHRELDGKPSRYAENPFDGVDDELPEAAE